ncbi:MAG: translation initiation factor IF-2 [Hyphomicrobiales bacterium]|nr:translation initiation factor IF-2 [Hyphomicrobiales bacterium]
MTDQKTPGDKTLTVSPPKTLTLKRPVEHNTVKQSFSHGRSKSVVVEVKRRISGPGEMPHHHQPSVQAKPAAAPPQPVAPTPAPAPAPAAPKPAASMVLRTLSPDEQDARTRALADSRGREFEERRQAEEDARARAAREERERAEREAAAARQREEEERKRAEDDFRRRGRDEAVRRLGEDPPPARPPAVDVRPLRMDGRPPRIDTPRAPRDDRPVRTEGERTPMRSDGPRPEGGFRSARPEGGAPRPEGGFRPRTDGPRPEGGFRGPRPEGSGPRPDGGFRPRTDGPRPEGGFRGPRSEGDGPRGPRPAGGFGAPSGPRMLRTSAGDAPIDLSAPRRAPPGAGRPRSDDDDRAGVRRAGGAAKPGSAEVRVPKVGGDKSRGRLTLTNALEADAERIRSVAAFRRRVQRMSGNRGSNEPKEKLSREVVVPETITIQELANRMSERAVDVIRFLMKQGQMLKITDVVDADTAQLIAEDMGHTVKRVAEADVEEGLFNLPDDDGALSPRPAVVTIMGHVDHGKTSLLDAVRRTNVVSGEAGGITQHIGAYQVATPSGARVTFIDTPGHAAFTQMRARGAKVTDIVVLVVAANDSVMPQTIEAINHAKAAKVPLIVAINKIDLPDARPERVKTDLIQHEIQVESLGGDVLEVELSAKTRLNIDKLLEAIALQAELLNLTANPDRPAEGTVIEAKLDRGRGPVATVLVQRGTLRPGDIVVAGSEWGRVRALLGDTGATLKEAPPSMPVEVLGFNGTPEAGDRVAVVESEARAREITDYRVRQKRDIAAARGTSGAGRSLVDMMRDLKVSAGRKEFPLLVKGDVQGSVEAIVGALDKLGNDEVRSRVLLSGVGGINESDVTLAQASGAVVIGFNVRANKEAREAAERAGVEIRYYNIIYDLVDDVKAAMSGLLAPTLRETMLGTATMLEIFNITKVGKIAGCRVTEGTIERGQHVRLIRDNTVIHEGKLSTLKRFKDDVKEVQVGQECGMSFENYQDIRAGDVVECYRVEEIKRTL